MADLYRSTQAGHITTPSPSTRRFYFRTAKTSMLARCSRSIFTAHTQLQFWDRANMYIWNSTACPSSILFWTFLMTIQAAFESTVTKLWRLSGLFDSGMEESFAGVSTTCPATRQCKGRGCGLETMGFFYLQHCRRAAGLYMLASIACSAKRYATNRAWEQSFKLTFCSHSQVPFPTAWRG